MKINGKIREQARITKLYLNVKGLPKSLNIKIYTDTHWKKSKVDLRNCQGNIWAEIH